MTPFDSYLALADGAVFRGVSFGAPADAPGEAVFNTAMSGYQEILTDPSYAGQFMVLTSPEVGNYGLTADDDESRGMFLAGLVVRRANEPSNRLAVRSLAAGLRAAGKPALAFVDTRALALHLRDHGSQKAWLHVSPEPLDPAEAAARARAWEGLDGQDYAARVSTAEAYDFGDRGPTAGAVPLVVVYDFGVKRNILRELASRGLRVRVVPARTPAAEALALRPAGVFLSNGPADPAALPYAVENIRALLGRVPLFGICLGHQLLALACGAKTGRLPFGHHGANHPVKDVVGGRVFVTSQNHNFAVLDAGLPPVLEVTHRNLNDGTVEGLRHKTLPAFSVQFHPEAAPGPRDALGLFDAFAATLRPAHAPARMVAFRSDVW